MLLNTTSGATYPGLTLKAWAQIKADGTLVKGFNVSVVKGTVGIYTLNFTTALATSAYISKLTVNFFNDASHQFGYFVTSITTAAMGYTIQVGPPSGPISANQPHFIEVWE